MIYSNNKEKSNLISLFWKCEKKLKSKMCILQKETEETYHFKCAIHSALLHISEIHQISSNYLWGKSWQKIPNQRKQWNNQATNQNQQKKPPTTRNHSDLNLYWRNSSCIKRSVSSWNAFLKGKKVFLPVLMAEDRPVPLTWTT